MKIAIDLNDVIRDFSDNFFSTYLLQYNREFDTTDFEMWSHELSDVLPFKTDAAYKKFKYEDYAYEIFGKCATCGKNLPSKMNKWFSDVSDIETEEPIDISIVSTMEFGAGLMFSYFFISKLGFPIREVFFPSDSSSIWDRCDVLITANPDLINMKPDGKTVVKIEKEYNESVTADYEYKTMLDFIENIDNVSKLLQKDEK